MPSFSYFCESSRALFTSINELCSYERNVLDAYSVIQMVYNRLRWNMGTITVSHYIDIFYVTGILYQNDQYEHHSITDATVRYVKNFMNFFLTLSLSEVKFSLFPSCIQAASIVYATRKAAHIQ